MKHDCKNTVAMNFLALPFFFFGVWKWEYGQEANTFSIKMNPTGLIPAISFLQPTLMTWTLAPQNTLIVINWVTWRHDRHFGSDFRIINSLRLPVFLTCRILSSDLAWLWPHGHHSPFLTMLPTGLLSMSWISYVPPNWPSRPESLLLAMLPASIHPTPFSPSDSERLPPLLCLLLRDAFFIRPSQRPVIPPHIL